ncbi:MAG: di-trans,poly-cis-decaprenylcistransferase [Parcubacteria group bacterium CG1_02_36_42]|nr:MAG: di-trans,poly-cis-decaprenylcistransferase [Parcubacteria group bacterium CG1_02_36_42]
MRIPKHLVLFPDGNRRWALKRGLPAIQGHLAGRQNFERFLFQAKKRGIKVLTVFGFSTENWKRSKEEVNFLMKLFEEGLSEKGALGKLHKEGVRIKVIGQKEGLPKSLQKVIKGIENLTKNNKKFHLNLAVSYGGRWDILQAVQKIIKKKLPAKKITEKLIEKYLTTAGLPHPDLVIRAGGEKRFSNFLLWQSAYAELYFSDKLWPDFSEKDLDKALQDFSKRERRFGGKKVKQYLKA